MGEVKQCMCFFAYFSTQHGKRPIMARLRVSMTMLNPKVMDDGDTDRKGYSTDLV